MILQSRHAIPDRDDDDEISWISIIDEPIAVTPPHLIVFSCAPKVAEASDNHRYYLKGPAPEVVIAEFLGYRLAELVDLPSPPHAFARDPDGRILFASREMRLRGFVEQMLAAGKVEDASFIDACFAFDTWIANDDRKVNNVVASPIGGRTADTVMLYAIDFEKAHVLRGVSRFTIATMRPGSFRPGEGLIQFCTARPLERMCARIEAVTKDDIARIFHVMSATLGPLDWMEQGIDILASRAQRIRALVQEECDA